MIIHTLLAIDPGAKTGWAEYYFGYTTGIWTLVNCGVVVPDGFEGICGGWDMVVIENPQIYPHSKARPADILKLARLVGRYEERFADQSVELVLPHQWKGSVSGDIMCARIEATLRAKHPQDVPALDAYNGPKSIRHNMIDAIGLGRWALSQPFVTKYKPRP